MKASANYTLELKTESIKEGDKVWISLKDGFISPKAAISWAKTQCKTGIMRVIRVASPLYEGNITTPAPVYDIVPKAGEDKKTKPRKAKNLRIVQKPVQNASGTDSLEIVTELPIVTEPGTEGGCRATASNPSL